MPGVTLKKYVALGCQPAPRRRERFQFYVAHLRQA
jgi:hypothetical protein